MSQEKSYSKENFFLFKKYVKIKNGQRLNYVQNGFFKKVLEKNVHFSLVTITLTKRIS